MQNNISMKRTHRVCVIILWCFSVLLTLVALKNYGLSETFAITTICMFTTSLLLTGVYFIKMNDIVKGLIIVTTISLATLLTSFLQGGSDRTFMVSFIVLGFALLYFNSRILFGHGIIYITICVIVFFINPIYIGGKNANTSFIITMLATYGAQTFVIYVATRFGQNMIKATNKAAEDIQENAKKNKVISENLYESITISNNDVGILSEKIGTISKGALDMQRNMLDSLERTNSLKDVVVLSDKRVQENYDCTKELKSSFEEVVDGVNIGIKTVNEVSEDMNTISHAITSARDATEQMLGQMNKITNILSEIDAISLQTNILSLNASVEAARSGEHGRGFSVVAGEIRELAAKSAESAKNIADIVSELISITKVVSERVIAGDETVKEGSIRIQSMVECFNSLNNVANNVGNIVERESDLIEEFKKDYNAMSSEIHQVTESTQENVDMVKEIVSSIEEQNNSVSNISSQIKQITEVSKSLNSKDQ